MKFLILGLLFVLSACSHNPPQSTQARQYHQQIDMSGRLSAQFEQNNQPQSIHINFSWSQTPQQTLVTLSSPTGQTLATVLINAQGAQLDQAGKPAQYASDVDQLMFDALGWPLPVAGLRDWLQGFPDASHQIAITKATWDPSYFLRIDGWQLCYVSWASDNEEERPKRIDLLHQTEQAGLVTLRIVIDKWDHP